MQPRNLFFFVPFLIGIGSVGLVHPSARHEPGNTGDPEEAREIRERELEEEEELRETMTLLMTLRMKRALDLTRDQEEVILPLLEEIQEVRRMARMEGGNLFQRLRRLVRDPDSSDREIENLLERIRDLQSRTEIRQKEIQAEIEIHLDVRQRAKMIFFRERFRREMESRFRAIRGFERDRRMERGRRPGRR